MDYKDTLLMGKTDFQMKGNLPENEKLQRQKWDELNLYNKIREKNTNYDVFSEKLEQISEESRILYVALTRAIRNCVWIKNLDSDSNISWETLLER